MRILKNIICFLSITMLFQNIHSQNHDSKLMQYVIKTLNIELNESEHVYKLERVIPYKNDTSILLIVNPIAFPEDYDCDYCFEYDSHIIIINTKTKQIVNYLFENHESNGWVSDAVFIEGFEFDFAPYYLSANNRAIGIRTDYRNNSSASPMRYETLTLFIEKNVSLTKVLKGYEMYSYFGEWDTVCAGTFKEETKTLIIAKDANNSYFDIIAKNKLSTTKTFMKAKNCIENKKITTKQEILKFDGNRYIFEL